MTDLMDLLPESLALSTELSHQPPPIPPVPPIPNSLPPTASPSTPSLTQPQNNTIVGRKILKPTVPSKRTIPDRIPSNGSENTDIGNRRERAWYARILICTTVISSIDSTLAIFEDEIEKEEALAFKAYLGLAIAKFAAADSSSTPPQIPAHTYPNKANGQGLGKDKNFAKKVAVATPRVMKNTALNVGNVKEPLRLSKIPEIGEKTWAT
ncbi:hypothetical protein EPUL_005216, partial [Erysiphe pulchra]